MAGNGRVGTLCVTLSRKRTPALGRHSHTDTLNPKLSLNTHKTMKSSINERLFNSAFPWRSGMGGRRTIAGASGTTKLTLAWADSRQRQRIVNLANSEGRQTMNLRTMPGAKLAVLHHPDGRFAGWAGMDALTHPERPEVFSQFVYPAYRGLGFGALLEHVWWAYLSAWGCKTAYMRMEFDSNQRLFSHRLASGFCREVAEPELGTHFVSACRNCELYGKHCTRQAYLAVDVPKALAESVKRRGSLDICRLPIKLKIDNPPRRQTGSPYAVAQ